MQPSRFSLRGLQTLCLLLAVAHVATAQKKTKVYHHHEPAPDPCPIPVDYSSTEGALRTSIFKAETETAAKIMLSNMTLSLGAGFMYDDAQECLLVQSADRTRDPDIVTIQAIALNAEKTGDTLKLATAAALSFHRECECPIYSPKELDIMITETKALLDDPEERKYILEWTGDDEHEEHDAHAEPAHEHDAHAEHAHAEHAQEHDAHGRRLQRTRRAPHNSCYCAHCQPRRSCRTARNCIG